MGRKIPIIKQQERMKIMPVITNSAPQLPKDTNRSQLREQSAEARAADLKVWRDTLYRSGEFREALFGNTYTDRFAYEGAAFIMNENGKLESANTLWDEPDRYHDAVMSNRLFVRDSRNMMRQVQVRENDAGATEVGLSQPLNSMSAVQAPPVPSFWKRIIFRIFFLSEMREYDRQKAAYDAMNTDEAKATFQGAIRAIRGDGAQKQEGTVTTRQLQQEQAQLEKDIKQLDEQLRQFDQQRAARAPQQANPQPVPASVAQPVQPAQQPIQQEQPVQKPEQPAHITRGLAPYSENYINGAFKNLSIPQKDLPKVSPVKVDGETAGVLMAMALGSKDLSVRINQAGERKWNEPDTNYERIVGHLFANGPVYAHKTTDQGFVANAYRNVKLALKEATESGDYSKLGKLIADGLTQNNKTLQVQRKLTDDFTAYANLGSKVLDLLAANPELEQAVKDQLGPESKQFDIAKAAKNISDLRVDTMKDYPSMVNQYGVFTQHNTTQGVKWRPAILGDTHQVAKVCVLSDIEVDMNNGNFKLEDSKFVDPEAAGNCIADIENTDVLGAFLWERNRGALLQNPVQMKVLNAAAIEEHTKQQEMQEQMKEMGIENQPQERALDISFG